MTDVPAILSQVACNGEKPPENGQQAIPKTNEEPTDVNSTLPFCREEPSLEDLPPEGNQQESGKSQGNVLLNWSTDEHIPKENPEENLFIVHKAITDISLQETSADEMTFREGKQKKRKIRFKIMDENKQVVDTFQKKVENCERKGQRGGLPLTSFTHSYGPIGSGEPRSGKQGHQWEKIPLSSSNQEISRQERIVERPWEGREDVDKNKAYEATEIEWLGFRKPTQADMLHSKHDQEQEVWEEEINNDDDDCNDGEDEVRVIEFKKKYEEGSQFKEEGDVNEDTPLSSPGSQPVTPDEQPTLGKKSDISRNAYSRYNTISYRKIRKGNTKQRIDEFESMMHL